MKRRALLSVYDKDGILELAAYLSGADWELVSTGGTAAYLKKNGFTVTDVSSITGFPECLDGRVKTLHPAIHAGLLARRDEASHMNTLSDLKLGTIDLVCVNLYPFFEKVQAGLSLEETVEFIDIGGPTMLRSAAKNYRDVFVLTDPADYEQCIEELKSDKSNTDFRKHLAGKVFNLTSAYDAAISRYLLDEEYPEYWSVSMAKKQKLRYGENSHQSAALYLSTDTVGALGSMEQLQGKELSYNNIRDLDLAWKTACAFGLPAAGKAPAGSAETAELCGLTAETALPTLVAVKHNTPCGIGSAATLSEAFDKAYACDPVSIFGGILACTTAVDEESAQKMAKLFFEIVVAPEYSPEALKVFSAKKNLRVMICKTAPADVFETITVDGGLLVQSADRKLLEKWELVTKKAPAAEDIEELVFGMRAVSYVKSNAITVVKNRAALGIGGGQTNRIWAAQHAIERAKEGIAFLQKDGLDDGTAPRIMASDAFFPFADVVECAAKAGIECIIQPGGSIRDKESIEACDRLGIAMVFTGTRHFKH